MNCEKCKQRIPDDEIMQARRDYSVLNMWACWNCIKKHLLKLKADRTQNENR
jgi:hypothetical protein